MLRQKQKTQHNITLQTAKRGAQKKASRQKADEVRVGDWAKGHGRQDLRAGLELWVYGNVLCISHFNLLAQKASRPF